MAVRSTPSAERHGGGAARPSAHRVVVVGAGIGGLVAALQLAVRGLEVTLIEAGAEPGGKMRALEVDGARIDAGPTVFTMRWVFDQILADAGTTLEALVKLTPLSLLARHAWEGQAQRLDLFADLERSVDAVAAFSSPAEARRFRAFCAEAARVYRRLEGPHIRSARPGLVQMVSDLGPAGLHDLARLGPFASLWRTLGRHFHDPRLRQLFARYATYCGSSPWLAPATLMLVAHVEMEGVWSIEGGMHRLALQLAGLAQARGVRLRLGCAVERIEVAAGAVRGVRLAGGELLAADSVVFAGDARALALGLLGPAVRSTVPPEADTRSLSALTWALHVRAEGFPLARHSLFFTDGYEQEFSDIFERRRLPRRATVYVCAQDRLHGDEPAPAGRERLLLLVNAPASHPWSQLDATELDACEYRTLTMLQRCGLHLKTDHPAHSVRRAPQDFAQLYPGSAGALYGPATHGWMALFKRAAAATAIRGLYLAGGSVHPGAGVPMAAMSGRLAAATLMAHLDSTSRSSRVRISGGTPTRSATTAAMP